MNIKRLSNIRSVQAADDFKAFLLTLQTQDGDIALEIEAGKIGLMLSALLACARTAGDHTPPAQDLIKTTPSQTVLIPCEEFATVRQAGGGLWLMLRAGCMDLSVALPDPRASQALAHALLNPR